MPGSWLDPSNPAALSVQVAALWLGGASPRCASSLKRNPQGGWVRGADGNAMVVVLMVTVSNGLVMVNDGYG